MIGGTRVSRRRALFSAMGIGATALFAACSQAAPPSPTAAPAASAGGAPTPAPTAAPAATAAPQPTTAAAQPVATTAPQASPTAAAASQTVQQLPRNQTLIMSLSDAVNQFTDVELQNPFMPGIARNGWQFAFEPLYFYDMWWTDQTCGPQGLPCKSGEIPWLAESYSYNQDFTQLMIKLRTDVTWSDGQPFTADDVAYTLNMLMDNAPKLTYSVEMKNWVKEAVALDPHTAQITLNSPNLNFMFDYFQWHSDLGVQIVPKHIFQGQDPTTFTNLDFAKGWPVVTGPWKLVLTSPEQRFWDRRDDWWAAKSGFHALPKMKRIITLPNYQDDKQIELLANNEVDSTHGFQQAYTVPTALQRNPKLSTWTTDNKPPYGALDISTATTFDFNDSKPPFNDPDIRWAINHALNRDQIVQVGAHGLTAKTVLPFPPYGALKPYYDGVSDILQKYPIDDFDLKKTAQIMESKGYAKDQGGFWAKDGKRFSWVLTLPPPFFQDIAPVIVEQLRKGGFDVSFKSPANAGTLEATGQVDAFLDVPGGAVRDPYPTLAFLLSKYSAPTGQPAIRSYRWKNDEYDKLVNQLGTTDPSDPKFMTIYHQAMELWIANLPMIPLILRYIYITPNTTYWTNWPDEKYPYTLPSGWHRTSGLFINTLEPTGG
ncbi:MAG: ABC transporter substrate-binding protein [Chloroflexota bacterium]